MSEFILFAYSFFSLFTVNMFGFVIGELLVCMIFFKNVLFT